jgi:DNA helicase-2/ATP-dependent DNA helicase PcrA
MEDGKALLEKQPPGNMPAVEKEKNQHRVKSNSRKDEQTLVSGEGLSVCVSQLINDSGLAEYHLIHEEITSQQRLSNLQELVNAASLYPGNIEGLLKFLEHIELDRSMEESTPENGDDKVTLITFHNTKGLEFKKVIMTGLEQGVFPREDKKGDELEEERRLFYVGATRAMDELYLTSCRMRRIRGMTALLEPSVFLREIDKDCLKTMGAAPGNFNARRYFHEGVAAGNFNAMRQFHESAARRPQGNGYGGKPALSEAERESGWHKGQRLFHDDYGYGAVIEVNGSEDGPVVSVRFDTGRELRFLSEYQGKAFEKIGNDG